jgi:D-aminoacyl-tRNA deacylase
MKAILQRVSKASVTVDRETIGAIAEGLLVLICGEPDDTHEKAAYFARKIAAMRIFEDAAGKMNKSVKDVGGAILVVSQFTLAAEWRKGNRPSFSAAAGPEAGAAIYDDFCALLKDEGVQVETGEFGASMEVSLINAGPVTIVMDD